MIAAAEETACAADAVQVAAAVHTQHKAADEKFFSHAGVIGADRACERQGSGVVTNFNNAEKQE